MPLDFDHLSQHVNDAKRKNLSTKTEAGEKWASEMLHALRHEGYDVFFQKLLDWRSTLRGLYSAEAMMALEALYQSNP